MNKNTRLDFMATLLLKRSRFIEILALAVLVAFATSLAASAFFTFFVEAPFTALVIALAIIFACLSLVGYVIFKGKTYMHSFEGFFLYDPNNNLILNCPRYQFSRELRNLLKWSMYQDEDLKISWKTGPLKELLEPLKDTKDMVERRDTSKLESARLILNASECFVLDTLSKHVRDYFSKAGCEKDRLFRLSREDAAQLVLDNRILEVISRPISDRPEFVPKGLEITKDDGIYEMVTKNGFFRKFELLLPFDSVIRRISPGCFELKMKRMQMIGNIKFDGSFANIPNDYILHFFDEPDPSVVKSFRVIVEVQASYNFGSILTPSGWEYYEWFDSFLDAVDEAFERQSYFRQIGWEAAYTLLNVLRPDNESKNPTKELSTTL